MTIDVGKDRCFLSNEAARFYFNVPVAIFVAFNTLIFMATLVSLIKSFKKTAKSLQASKAAKQVILIKLGWSKNDKYFNQRRNIQFIKIYDCIA